MEDSVKKLFEALGEFGGKAIIHVIGALLILFIGSKVIKWVLKLVKRGKKFSALPPNTKTLILDLIKVALYVLLIVIIAGVLGIETASITAAIASAGLAIGLAMQGSLSNFAGGIMILLFHPFSVGDYITDGSHEGTVTDIGVFYTTICTLDNKVITIPNGTLSNSAVTDFSTKDTRRVDLKISVAYNSNIELVKKVLLSLAEADDRIFKDPAPFVRLGEHGESALVFYMRLWCKAADYWDVNFDMLEKSKKVLDGNGIKIPYPQMDVHLDK